MIKPLLTLNSSFIKYVSNSHDANKQFDFKHHIFTLSKTLSLVNMPYAFEQYINAV